MNKTARGSFHHVDLNVGDLAASKAVYGPLLEYLGYVVVKDDVSGCEWDLKRDDEPGGGSGASLGLKPVPPGEASYAHRRYAAGLHHLAWRAESREDVDRLHALLAEKGVLVLDPPAEYPQYSGDYYAAFFEDPDGIKLEIVYAPGWI